MSDVREEPEAKKKTFPFKSKSDVLSIRLFMTRGFIENFSISLEKKK